VVWASVKRSFIFLGRLFKITLYRRKGQTAILQEDALFIRNVSNDLADPF